MHPAPPGARPAPFRSFSIGPSVVYAPVRGPRWALVQGLRHEPVHSGVRAGVRRGPRVGPITRRADGLPWAQTGALLGGRGVGRTRPYVRNILISLENR